MILPPIEFRYEKNVFDIKERKISESEQHLISGLQKCAKYSTKIIFKVLSNTPKLTRFNFLLL
jgi:hypothetical protein